ncbi:MAG TPA: peptide-methionine (S)-S-oxide reductase MsrA [Gemmatimonadaceae bacterium]|nr:peptide-methionine (S)-S-oxide reductase MsrA [Gemmatimonadaceae bacterium]
MPPSSREIATLGGGCFWCIDEVFRQLKGVERVESGYSGGQTRNPTYQQVCSGDTGHAEVVQVTFDPSVISYGELLDVFFTVHDPTTPNRQGADIGTQYRSVIFHHSDQQRAAAAQAIADLDADGAWRAPIVTEVVPFTEFWPAESYHQEYYRRNSAQPYCRVVIEPKIAKLRRAHLEKLRA